MKLTATLKWGVISNTINLSYTGWTEAAAVAHAEARYPGAVIEVVSELPTSRDGDAEYETNGW